MRLIILGSGGCMPIPKPLCSCRVCREARKKGIPYTRSGPSAFLQDDRLLIDTPAEIATQLNRENIRSIEYLMLTHLDPDHVEGLRIVEQIALDFRTWKAYPGKQITLLLPEQLEVPLRRISTQYGTALDYYLWSGFLRLLTFQQITWIQNMSVVAIPVERGSQTSYIYVFEKDGRKLVYAPCDIKPFPDEREEVRNADILVIQPGIFEAGLRHGFRYPADHVSRATLYTFEQTLALARRIGARRAVFIHIEEYWHRSYDDYLKIERKIPGIRFAYDGMEVIV